MMITLSVVVIAGLLPCILCQDISQDPLCKDKACPKGQVCRHYKPCGLTDNCNITAICTATKSTRGGCNFGEPVIYDNNGRQETLTCYNEAPCPSNGYCSTALMDTSAVCCLSDPAMTVNPNLECPAPDSNPDRHWCVDGCKYDGDCFSPEEKCCYTGCAKECVYVPPPMPSGSNTTDLVSPPLPENMKSPPPPLPNMPEPSPPTPHVADPCHGKVCPKGQMCRHFKPCGLNDNCNITAICSASRVDSGDGCEHGAPVLYSNRGREEMLVCYREAPCPDNGYCSTVLQDTSSRCCLADPAKTVRPGTCPPPTEYPRTREDWIFCYDECKYDGDCGWDSKCCNTGCKMECIPPETEIDVKPPVPPTINPPLDPCDSKMCPRNTFCRRIGQPCRNSWSCRPEGECNQCPYVPFVGRGRGFEVINDPDGCPALIMTQPPIQPPVFKRPRRPRPFHLSPLTYLLWSDFYNKK